MFVRQLVGPQAGEIIEMPHHAGQACLAVGTAESVTDEEIAEAGLRPAAEFVPVKPDALPDGYRAEPADGGGYNVIDAGGVNLTPETDIPNLAAARSFALDHAGLGDAPSAPAEPEVDEKPDLPADWRDLHFMKQISLAKQFDPSVTKKDEAIAVLEAAEKAQQV